MNTIANKKTKKHYDLKTELMVIVSVVIFAIAIFAIYFEVKSLSTPQSTTSRASSELVSLAWGSFPAQINTSQNLNVPILINSGQYNFSALQIKGKIYNVSKEKISLTPINVAGLNSVISSLSIENGATAFTLVYFSDISSTTLYSSQGQTIKLADINISGLSEGNYSVHITGVESTIVSYNFPSIALSTPSDKNFTVITQTAAQTSNEDKKGCNLNCATDTECKSEFICYKGYCRSEKDKEDPNCAIIPDQGIHRGCNEYCADSRECDSRYTCYYNRCRNALNLLSESCTNPSPTPKSKTTANANANSKGTVIKVTPTPTVKPSPELKVTIVVDDKKYGIEDSTQSGKTASSSAPLRVIPSPTPKPSPSPTLEPSPTPIAQQQTAKENSVNWLKIIAIVVSLGLIGAIAFFVFINWKPTRGNY